MKKSLLAAAVLSAVSFGAHADGVELYGVLDVAVASISNGLSIDDNFPSGYSLTGGVSPSTAKSVTGLITGGIQGSRWGIKGSEDLGGGMKAIFNLESGISITNGSVLNGFQSKVDGSTYNNSASSLNGQLFGRTAWVGLSDAELGSIKFGRQYNVITDVSGAFDPVQNANLFSPTGNSGTRGGGAGATENSRQDNSVKYNGKTGNVSYTAMYKFGGIAGSTSAGSSYGFQLGYAAGDFETQVAFSQANDVVTLNTAATTTTATGILQNDKAYIVGVKYKFNPMLTGKASYQRYTVDNPSNPTLSSSFTSYYGYNLASVAARNNSSQSVTVASIGGDYKLSDKLGLYVGYYSLNYDAVTALSTGVTTASFSENYTSLLLDYNLSKRTDVYLGGMQVNPSRSTLTSVNIVAAGLRHKF